MLEFEMSGPLSLSPSSYVGSTELERDLAGLLAQANGAAAYGGAFVLLPSGPCDVVPSLEEFNAGAWKSAYECLAGVTLFGYDSLGFPFGVDDEGVVHLNPENGTIDRVAPTFGAFFRMMQDAPDSLIGLPVFRGFLAAGYTLKLRERVAPKMPFILGGGNEPDGFYAADVIERLDFNAHLYGQTKDMPEGTRIRFDFTG